jgi:hypothetical protein
MTEEAIKRQIEIIEKAGREIRKSPESARKFIDDLEARTGIPFNEERARKAGRFKKKNDARLSAI